MKKLSVKNNDILAFINIDSNKKFYEVYNVRKLSDDKIEVITGTCDSNKNGVIPFRKEIVTLEDYIDCTYNINIIYFNNDKALYETRDKRNYIIDLNNVKFKKEENDFIPINPIKQIYSCFIIDDENIIECELDGTRIYNVSNDKYLSLNYNFINFSETYDDSYDAFYILRNNKYSDPLILRLFLDKNFNLSNEVVINDLLVVYLNNEIIKDEHLIKKYCDNIFTDYNENILVNSKKIRFMS